MRNPDRQLGFTLTNILISIAITAAVVIGINSWNAKRERDRATKLAQGSTEKIRSRIQELMKSDAAWKNTLATGENAGMACLREHTTCLREGGPFVMRDQMNRMVYDSKTKSNGFTIEGNACPSFSETGNDLCPLRLDLTWSPQCGLDCENPSRVILKGLIRFRGSPDGAFAGVKIPDVEFGESRPAIPGDPQNCYDQLKAGRDADGMYLVRPDPKAPPFPVYCDQKRDGGGWALVVSAGSTDYQSLPENNALTPTSTGRLPTAKVAAYLGASPFLAANNLRLELPDVDGGIVLAASTGGAMDPDDYVASAPPGDCRRVVNAPNEASHSNSGKLALAFTGAGEVGISEKKSEPEGFHGFYICYGANAAGKTCGTGCNRAWRGQLFRQKGRLWIR